MRTAHRIALAAATLALAAAARATAQDTPTKPEPPKPAVDSAFKRAGDEMPPDAIPTDVEEGDSIFRPTYDPNTPWLLSYYPYFTGSRNDSPALAFRVYYYQPADYEERTTYHAAVSADVGATANGSRFVTLRLRAPAWKQGWRFNALLSARREARFGFYGLGNNTEVDEDLADDSQPYLFRVRRARYLGQVEVTRQLRGPWHAALMGEVAAARFSALPGPSLFRDGFGGRLEEDDISARLALIYDTRDTEYNTKRGLLLEAGGQIGSGGDGYQRLYAVLRGYYPIREGTVVAAQLAGSEMFDAPPLDARFVIPAWERPIGVLGGDNSLRSLEDGRLAGTGVLFGNLEVRHDLLNVGDYGAVTLLGFLDAGRVFEGENFNLKLNDLEVGGGGGVAIRVLRSTIFTFNFAWGDGFNFSIGSGWAF